MPVLRPHFLHAPGAHLNASRVSQGSMPTYGFGTVVRRRTSLLDWTMRLVAVSLITAAAVLVLA